MKCQYFKYSRGYYEMMCQKNQYAQSLQYFRCHTSFFNLLQNLAQISLKAINLAVGLKLGLRPAWVCIIWAATWQNQQCRCAPCEDSDQPWHPPSLIRVFAVRMKKSWVLSYPLSTQPRLWSDWADAQADPSLRWAHTHFVGFVMSRLILEIFLYSRLTIFTFRDTTCVTEINTAHF